MPQLPLPKRTKAEIIDQYNDLLKKYDELKAGARLVHDPASREALDSARNYTPENIVKSIADLKTALGGELDGLSQKLIASARKLGELETAVEISRKNLDLHYHIEIAAETLEELVAENEVKKKEFAGEEESRRRGLEEEMTAKKRDWAREEEEYGYQVKTKRERNEEIYQLARQKKEQELIEREARIKAQEEEIASLKKQVENAPKELEKALAAKEQETMKSAKVEFDREMAEAKRQWEAARMLSDTKLNYLQDKLKKYELDVASLRQETEQAKRRAQELAVKIIEGGARAPKEEEEKRRELPMSQ